MKKIILSAVLTAMSFVGYAQVPSYYDDADIDLTGDNLLDELADLITDTHTTFLSYTPGVWTTLQEADLNPNDSSEIFLIYGADDNDSDDSNDITRSVSAIDSGGTSSSDYWNREHVFPKSLGNPNLGTTGPGADAHHLRPSDPSTNSTRSNRKFADGSGDAGITSDGYWYPGDEWKGDVARMIMYVYLRYDDRCLPSAVGEGNTLSTDSNMIDLFLEWNVEDPVSDFENQRNDVIEGIQGNRNPFIDNPAFATSIWGGDQAEDIFGNGGSSNDSDGGSDSDGGNNSESDLIISEYVEGSSYNKAIEIANTSGSSVNLSNYSLKKDTNGGGSWATTLSLSGTLSSGSTYVIVNSSASSTLTASADLTSSSSVMTFNGNDPVGLFYNDTLIDVIGNFGSSASYGTNATLVRNTNEANTTYNSSEWTTYSSDTYSYLGSYNSSSKSLLSEIDTPTTITSFEIKAYPNPATEFISFISDYTTENIGYTIYNQAGAEVKTGVSVNNFISVENLSSGLYFITVNTGNNIYSTKFIKK